MNRDNLIRIKNERKTTTKEWLEKHSIKPIPVPTCEFPDTPALSYEENQAQIDAITAQMLSEMRKPPEKQRFVRDNSINEEIKENLREAQANIDETRRLEESAIAPRRRGRGKMVVVLGLIVASLLLPLLHTTGEGSKPNRSGVTAIQ